MLSECGFKYYVVFVDDFSEYTQFYPMFCKSDVFNAFLPFKLQVENLLSMKIKCLRFYGGGECVSSKF